MAAPLLPALLGAALCATACDSGSSGDEATATKLENPCLTGTWKAKDYDRFIIASLRDGMKIEDVEPGDSTGEMRFTFEPTLSGRAGILRQTATAAVYKFSGQREGIELVSTIEAQGESAGPYEVDGETLAIHPPVESSMKMTAAAEATGVGLPGVKEDITLLYSGPHRFECSGDTLKLHDDRLGNGAFLTFERES